MDKPSELCPPPPPPVLTRVIITPAEQETLTRDDIIQRWKENEVYLDYLEQKLDDPKDTDEKLKIQQEAARKENVLVMRLATKEQEMQEFVAQIQELKQSQRPSATQLQNMLLDPAVNLLFEKMKGELTDTREKLEQAQNDLSAWKFTPDSVTGKKLMAKCRMLIQENQELGKQLSQGRIAQLEAELALQKKYSEELKGTQDEMNEFVIQLDEEVEGMQATICTLQQQLKQAKTHSESIQSDNQNLLLKIKDLDSTFVTTNQPVKVEYSEQNNDIISINHGNETPEASPSDELPAANTEEVASPKSVIERTNHTSSEMNNISPVEESPTEENHILRTTEPIESMDVDDTDVISSVTIKTEDFSNYTTSPVAQHTSVLQTVISNDDELKNGVDNSYNNHHHISPVSHVSPKTFPSKTSFSITDLLSDNKELQRKDDVNEYGLIKKEASENGMSLNGLIDDAAI